MWFKVVIALLFAYFIYGVIRGKIKYALVELIGKGDFDKTIQYFNKHPQSVFDSAALAFAVSQKKTRIVEEFLKRGASVNQSDEHGRTPLRMAIGNPEMVNFLLEKDADVHADPELLQHAAIVNDCTSMLTFIEKGLDPNIKNLQDYYPIDYAAGMGNIDAAECLIKNGAKYTSLSLNEEIKPFKGSMAPSEHYERIQQLMIENLTEQRASSRRR